MRASRHSLTGLPRRRLFALAAGAALATANLSSPRAEQIVALKTAARRIGLRYGSDSDSTIKSAPAPYGALFARQCDLYAANLPWSRLAPSPDAADPATEDPNLAFAFDNGIAITGAHLVWHEAIPGWVKDLTAAGEVERAMESHIRAMGRRYAGKVYSWNVVNEGLNPGNEGRPDGLRDTPMLKALGPQYMDIAFRVARQANPTALLVYNDYNMEMNKPLPEMKRRALLKLLEEFRRSDTPIDAVGLQSHLRLDGSPFDERVYRSFLAEIAAMGFKIMITELDVLDLNTPSDIAARDQAVADLYRRFLDVALDQPALVTLVTWGLSDRYTWLTARRSPAYARRDGMPARPLPFDDSFLPKPAYFAILAALSHAPQRKAA